MDFSVTKMTTRLLWITVILLVPRVAAAAEDNADDSIKRFLHENFDAKNAGMVVGLVDEHGPRVFSAGKLDNGTAQDVTGDTVFGIGSVTKTFTVLLLQDMVERGEMKLDDSVGKYLPASVKIASWQGKQMTLLDLATHTSGLPFDADNLNLKDPPGENIFAGYTVEKLYAFLNNHAMRREPGTQFEYSNVGMALLAHVIELRAGATFESLLVERICRPLHMDSTRIAVTPEMQARLATGHGTSEKPLPGWNLGAYAGAGALRSTANDLLKYVAANVGLTESALTPLMRKTHVIRHTNSPGILPGEAFGNTAMAWKDYGVYQPPGMRLIGHGGGAGGYSAFVGLDLTQRRGVVVLSNQRAAAANTYAVGWRILQRAPVAGKDVTTLMALREHVGLGIALELDARTGAVRITKVFANSPAAHAGVSAGLVVQKIGDVTVAGKSLAECVALMRGDADTEVRLELLDPQRKQVNGVDLVRRKFLIDG
jgi:serine-type D-Ala-D-Ala carboxypeptidase/endopeptidase